MANPQVEDGHTQIANEILEHLVRIHLAPNQWQVLICVIRKTYGYHKKVDYIANCQITEATGLCKSVVSRSLQALGEINLIIRDGKYTGFQKDWELWKKLAILSTKVSSPLVTQKIKDNILSLDNKESIKKKYGEFQNVLLTDREYGKLKERFGDTLLGRIEELSLGIESKGYKYHSHYATILNWARKDNLSGSKSSYNPRTQTNGSQTADEIEESAKRKGIAV